MPLYKLPLPLLVLCLLATVSAYGQSAELAASPAEEQSTSPASGFTVTVAPLSLLGRFRRVRAGVIWSRPRWNYLLDLEYAPGFSGVGRLTTQARHHFFYGIRPEIRYAIARKANERERYRQFVGLEVPVNYAEAVVDNGQFHNSEGEYISFDRGIRHRERVSVLAKYTLAVWIDRHFYVDGYAGMGVARRKNYYTELVNARPEDSLLEDFEWNWGASPAEGTVWLLDVALGFRLGYRL
ncbi:hypothetical protein [Lewinella sp. IMCC34191]|uniref:hypothetical protein n=1 Tax=Lewinella sp. IMCC34191 TaxID=2259172 RepID=UPI000E27C785|nr:hypothetical protein [Lewinella sp. IMCC34191]